MATVMLMSKSLNITPAVPTESAYLRLTMGAFLFGLLKIFLDFYGRLTESTQASAPAPTDSYVQELTKKIWYEVVDEVEAKLNQEVYDEVDAKVSQKVHDNLTLVL
ncbi:hypothetical protein OROMI_004948 [Orobanche minor]